MGAVGVGVLRIASPLEQVGHGLGSPIHVVRQLLGLNLLGKFVWDPTCRSGLWAADSDAVGVGDEVIKVHFHGLLSSQFCCRFR